MPMVGPCAKANAGAQSAQPSKPMNRHFFAAFDLLPMSSMMPPNRYGSRSGLCLPAVSCPCGMRQSPLKLHPKSYFPSDAPASPKWVMLPPLAAPTNRKRIRTRVPPVRIGADARGINQLVPELGFCWEIARHFVRRSGDGGNRAKTGHRRDFSSSPARFPVAGKTGHFWELAVLLA